MGEKSVVAKERTLVVRQIGEELAKLKSNPVPKNDPAQAPMPLLHQPLWSLLGFDFFWSLELLPTFMFDRLIKFLPPEAHRRPAAQA